MLASSETGDACSARALSKLHQKHEAFQALGAPFGSPHNGLYSMRGGIVSTEGCEKMECPVALLVW